MTTVARLFINGSWSMIKVAEALMIDRKTTRNEYKRHPKADLPFLLNPNTGSSAPEQ